MVAPCGGGVKVGTGVAVQVGADVGVRVGTGDAVQVGNGEGEGVNVGMGVGDSITLSGEETGTRAVGDGVGIPRVGEIWIGVTAISDKGEGRATTSGAGVLVGVGVLLACSPIRSPFHTTTASRPTTISSKGNCHPLCSEFIGDIKPNQAVSPIYLISTAAKLYLEPDGCPRLSDSGYVIE
jgi:hypothetical protein